VRERTRHSNKYNSLFTAGRTESGFTAMGHFDTFCACGTDKVVVTEKRCSAYKESENIDDNADSDQVVVFEKKFPPVSIVRGKSSKLYAVTTDTFHRYHLYFTKRVNSNKKSLGFVF